MFVHDVVGSEANPAEYKLWGDTRPQWIMAVAAIVGLILGGFTLELLRRTLSATRDAGSHAKDAADAAKDAVTVTRDIGEAQVRAYLHVKSITVSFLSGLEKPTFAAILSNTGQSPARDVVCGYQVWYEGTGFGEKGILPPDWRNAVGKAIPAGSEEEVPADAHEMALSPEGIARSKEPNFHVFMSVRAVFQYRDVFDKIWTGRAYFVGFVGVNPEPPGLFVDPFKVTLMPVYKAQTWGDEAND